MAIDTLDRVTNLPDETTLSIYGATWTKRGDRLYHDNYDVPISTLSSMLGQITVPHVPVQEPVFDAVESEPVTPATTVHVVNGLDPSDVQEALHEYLTDNTGLTGTEREGIMDILDNFRLERPAENVTVTIDVSGETEVSVSDSYIEENLIGGGVSTGNSTYEMTVDWTRTFEVERETESGCACGGIDTYECESLISEEGISGSVEDFNLSCTGSACVNC